MHVIQHTNEKRPTNALSNKKVKTGNIDVKQIENVKHKKGIQDHNTYI